MRGAPREIKANYAYTLTKSTNTCRKYNEKYVTRTMRYGRDNYKLGTMCTA